MIFVRKTLKIIIKKTSHIEILLKFSIIINYIKTYYFLALSSDFFSFVTKSACIYPNLNIFYNIFILNKY